MSIHLLYGHCIPIKILYAFQHSSSSRSVTQFRRHYSNSENPSTAESPQAGTELEKKLQAEVETLNAQIKTLEETNSELLVLNSFINMSFG